MNIQFWTFGRGHLVSDREFDRLQKGFAKVGMYLFRHDDEKQPSADMVMVKGWSYAWEQIPHDKPVVYLSIGTEWKNNAPGALNEPIRELYEKSDVAVHISEYCQESHRRVFVPRPYKENIIIPACEPNLQKEMRDVGHHRKLKLAVTSNGERPVKRIGEIQRLAEKYNVELVLALGNVSDFSYYHDCDGGISLSRKEGMPNNILEMMSYGLPCIVTNYGGAKEAVGDAGIVIRNDPQDVPWDPDHIEPVDDKLFEQAITDFITNYPQLWLKTRERVLTELNDYVTACKFKEIFIQCLA